MASVNSRRKYRSPLREEAALRGQQAVIAAAADLFVEQGYARTTIDQIAERARVSRQTVFATGSKAQLLALARRAAIGGESVLGNEPEFAQILATPDAAQLLQRFAEMTSRIARRWAPLHAVLEEAAASDPSLTELRQTSRDDMHGCARQVVTALRSQRRAAPRPGAEGGRRRAVAADRPQPIPPAGHRTTVEPPRLPALASRRHDPAAPLKPILRNRRGTTTWPTALPAQYDLPAGQSRCCDHGRAGRMGRCACLENAWRSAGFEVRGRSQSQ